MIGDWPDWMMVRSDRKRGPGGPLDREGRGLADLAFEVEDNALEIGFVQDVLALGGSENECTATEVVDPASDALGLVVDASQKAIAEDLVLRCGDAEMMFDT